MAPDDEAFSEALRPLVRPGYELALAMLSDRALAEDAVQEAAIRAWRSFSSLRDLEAVRPWFLAIVANQCRTLRSRRWWKVLRLPDLAPAAAPASDDAMEMGMDLERALDRLGFQDRLALYLHFQCDLSYAEVGRIMGTSMTAARSRITRAAHRLEPLLRADEVLADA